MSVSSEIAQDGENFNCKKPISAPEEKLVEYYLFCMTE